MCGTEQSKLIDPEGQFKIDDIKKYLRSLKYDDQKNDIIKPETGLIFNPDEGEQIDEEAIGQRGNAIVSGHLINSLGRSGEECPSNR